MWQWWNSLKAINKVNWWMSCLAVISGLLAALFPDFRVFGLCGALFAGLAWWLGNQCDDLKSQREQELAKPRKLSPQQQNQFIAILKESPQEMMIISPVGDQEASAFAKELLTLFDLANWRVYGKIGEQPVKDSTYGIKIELDSTAETEDQIRRAWLEISVLERAFDAVGMSVNIDFVNEINLPKRKKLRLYIGHKPEASD